MLRTRPERSYKWETRVSPKSGINFVDKAWRWALTRYYKWLWRVIPRQCQITGQIQIWAKRVWVCAAPQQPDLVQRRYQDPNQPETLNCSQGWYETPGWSRRSGNKGGDDKKTYGKKTGCRENDGIGIQGKYRIANDKENDSMVARKWADGIWQMAE